MAEKPIKNFDMTLEECKRVFDQIDRLVIVDKDHKIRYISQDLLDVLESVSRKDLRDPVGKAVEDVHPLSKITQVLESRKPQEECFYLSGGEINIARMKPVIADGALWGAIDYDIFRSENDLRRFFDRIVEMSSSGYINFAKNIGEVFRSYNDLSKGFKYNVGNILGESPAIRRLRQEIYDLAESDSTVLIHGETGSGKEMIAQSIHNTSRRAKSRMVRINCAAIPDTLVESELFGYEEGTFTGAQKGGKIGKLEYANGGTVFLDEIDQLPYHVQPKLLRFLQEREIDRIGGSESIPLDVRMIAATNKDLKALVSQGRFREDLFYRLNVVEIRVPPLREHKEDIPLLVDYAIDRTNAFLGKDIKGAAPEVLELLSRYDWPGNIRELLNIIERAMNRCRSELLTMDNFDDFFFGVSAYELRQMEEWAQSPLEHIRDIAEADAIRRTLGLTGWNISKAAKILKISRPALYYKINKYKIERVDVK